MSEHILKINVSELMTIRVKGADGEVSEMPIARMKEVAHRFAAGDELRKLSESIDAISKLQGVSIEFVIPVTE